MISSLSRESASRESLENDDRSFLLEKSLRGSPSTTTRNLFWGSQTIIFLLSSILFAASFVEKRNQPRCVEKLSMYSPVLEVVSDETQAVRFDGSFAKPNAFKGMPSPEIDAAWNGITYKEGGVISITEEIKERVNASEYTVELSQEIGGGYMASVEVLHQLHCLNMLRQATYEDYYKDKAIPWQDSPQTLRYHLDHCIDNLRQKLMCDSDSGILTYVWVKDHAMPFPDFNVYDTSQCQFLTANSSRQHKCRNFQAVLDWTIEHQTYQTENGKIERLPGAKEMESPP